MVLKHAAVRRSIAIAFASLACTIACTGVQPPPAAPPQSPAEPVALHHPELEASCTAGSVEACIELGRLGLRTSMQVGLPWLLRACELEPQACVAIGDALVGRRANASDPVVGAHAYRLACEADHRGACYELGVLHYLGLGVAIDDPQSARLHHRACAGGIPEGCAYLGHLYERGFGVRRNVVLAAHYRDLACRRGYDELCGHGVETSRAANAPAREPAVPVTSEAPPATLPPREQPTRKTNFKPTGAPKGQD